MATLFALIAFLSFFCIFIALIKPNLFQRFSKKPITRKKAAGVFSLIFLTSIIIAIAASPSSSTNPTESNDTSTSPDTSNTTETTNPNTPVNIPQVETIKTTPSTETSKTQPVSPTTTIPPTDTETNNTPTPSPIPSETISQKNAVRSAQSYLKYTAFSHDGLAAQLEYEKFSHADAVYGAENSGADWNEQAAKKAKSYMEYSAFSRGSLIAQLEYDKFTSAQAEYGADAVGL